MGPSWAVLELSWGHLRPQKSIEKAHGRLVGGQLAVSGIILERRARKGQFEVPPWWGPLRAVLGRLGGALGSSWGALG
eukprot:8843681-Pyramimonas_sp.AAC.1